MLTEWINVHRHKSSSVFKRWCSVLMPRLSWKFPVNFPPLYSPHLSHEKLFYSVLSPCFIDHGAKVSVFQTDLQIWNLQPAFRKSNSSVRPELFKKDKLFLLSVLSSVGSLCDAVAMAAWSQLARRLLVMPSSWCCSWDESCWRNPDYCYWQLIDLSGLVPSPPPVPFFCLSDVHNQADRLADILIHLIKCTVQNKMFMFLPENSKNLQLKFVVNDEERSSHLWALSQ